MDAAATNFGLDNRTPRLEDDSISKILSNLINDVGELRTKCRGAHSHGVLKGVDLTHGLHPSSLDAMPFKPPSRGLAHRIVPDHPVVTSRPRCILK